MPRDISYTDADGEQGGDHPVRTDGGRDRQNRDEQSPELSAEEMRAWQTERDQQKADLAQQKSREDPFAPDDPEEAAELNTKFRETIENHQQLQGFTTEELQEMYPWYEPSEERKASDRNRTTRSPTDRSPPPPSPSSRPASGSPPPSDPNRPRATSPSSSDDRNDRGGDPTSRPQSRSSPSSRRDPSLPDEPLDETSDLSPNEALQTVINDRTRTIEDTIPSRLRPIPVAYRKGDQGPAIDYLNVYSQWVDREIQRARENGATEALEAEADELARLTEPHRNRDGDLNMEDLPDDLRERIQAFNEKRRDSIPLRANSEIVNAAKEWLAYGRRGGQTDDAAWVPVMIGRYDQQSGTDVDTQLVIDSMWENGIPMYDLIAAGATAVQFSLEDEFGEQFLGIEPTADPR